MPTYRADVAVVGGGILGLAHALAAARDGRNVVLFERGPTAQGASVRNFGMIWPIGQPPGRLLDRALRTREIWLEIADKAGLWCAPSGSLHVAYADDEAAVLEEFCETIAPANGYETELLSPEAATKRSTAIRSDGLHAAMWSATEVNVDPREAIAAIPGWLAEAHGVMLRFGTAVREIDLPLITTSVGERWHVDAAIVCGGDDLVTLYPDILDKAPLTRCKLQMLRTTPRPPGWELGPMLAGGLTLRHYPAFANCTSLAAFDARIRAESPAFDRWGIHVMASQTGRSEITIGDSHEYGPDPSVFDLEEIDSLIIEYLRSFLAVDDLTIAQRWHGVYAKRTDGAADFVAAPADGVRIVTGVGGAGMSTGFGLAQEVWADLARERPAG